MKSGRRLSRRSRKREEQDDEESIYDIIACGSAVIYI